MKPLTTQQLFECLAPYLPYGLKVQVLNANTGKTYINEVIMLSGSYVNASTFISTCKPLLLPLDALTDELVEWFIEMFSGDKKQWEAKFINEIKNPRKLPFFIVQQIFKLHGDLFGLIEQGYAVNKIEVK